MIFDTCMSLLEKLREEAKDVVAEYCGKFTPGNRGAEEANMIYLNTTGEDVTVILPCGARLVIPSRQSVSDSKLQDIFMATLKVDTSGIELPDDFDTTTEKYKYFKQVKNRQFDPELHYVITGADLINKRDGVLIPDLMISVGYTRYKETLKNRAMHAGSTSDASYGINYRYYSKTKGERIWIVVGHKMHELVAEFSEETPRLEIHETFGNFKRNVTTIEGYESLKGENDKGVVIFFNECQAQEFHLHRKTQRDNYDSVCKNNAELKDTINKLNEKLAKEKRDHEDDLRSIKDKAEEAINKVKQANAKDDAIKWNKRSTVINSIMTVFSNIVKALKAIF